jgi:Bacterial regulatory helix-turn-helix protein, lysR family
MKRDDLNDLAAFSVVAEHGSFTRAAAELGLSQSALRTRAETTRPTRVVQWHAGPGGIDNALQV